MKVRTRALNSRPRGRARRRACTAALLAVMSGAMLAAPRALHAESQAADSLIVSLLTMGPGEMLFDRFGHAAIRVRRPLSGLDSAWNWGMYDFDAPNFIPRFLSGDTQYWMAGYPTPQFVNYYRQNGRVIWEQELELDQAQADTLLALLRRNALEANKYYRYDYYLDNCSTRIRDVIDKVLGGALKRQLDGAQPDTITWRQETLRLASAFPLIDFGMTFALGRRADATVTPWEEGFIPMRLRDRLRSLSVTTLSGPRPLVRAERFLNEDGRQADPKRGPALLMGAVVAALFGVGMIAALSRRAASSRVSRLALGATGAGWHLVAGMAGTLILLAGLFTKHTFMGANSAVLLGTPVSLALSWFYLRAWLTRANESTRRTARLLALMAAIAAVAGLLAQAIPGAARADLAPAMLAVPIHVAFALALVRRERVAA